MIGIDIADIERFKDIKESDLASWNKVFIDAEWQYCFKKPNPAQHLAGIFAVKEAVMKAVGESIMKQYLAVEVGHLPNGKPTAKLHVGENRNIEISISHDKNVAVAVAIISV